MRAFWKGTISFGLINIPVSIYTASREQELQFTLLHKKDLSEIRYARICKAEDKEIPYDQIVKGIEKNGRYVVMEEEDFKKAQGEKSSTIDIVAFCNDADIHSIYYDKPYFLKPGKQGEKAYFLLLQALQKTKKVALVRYTLRNHSHIAAIKAFDGLLILNQMRFQSQLIATADLEVEAAPKLASVELEMATKLIDQLSAHFDAADYHDSYVEDLQKAIQRKAKTAKAKPAQKEAPSAKIYDLMALLKDSLNNKKKKASAR